MSLSRLRTVRLLAGYGALACALPYFGLKVLWLTGSTLGVADRALMAQPSMVALNALTAGMDVVGIGLALAFAHGWGMRIPAWLILPPMWVAAGLLATFVIGVPIVAVLSTVAAGVMPRISGGPVEGWVYVLVYIGFSGLGSGLMLAFALHARTRWADVFHAPPLAGLEGSYPVHRALAVATACASALVAGLYLAWAFGATLGLPENVAARRTIIGSILNGIDAVLMLAAAAGVLMLVHGIGKPLPRWLALTLAWVGTGSMFGWGLWQTINVLGQTALMQGAPARAVVNLLGLLRLVLGLTMGLLMLFTIAERSRAAAQVPAFEGRPEGRPFD